MIFYYLFVGFLIYLSYCIHATFYLNINVALNNAKKIINLQKFNIESYIQKYNNSELQMSFHELQQEKITDSTHHR